MILKYDYHGTSRDPWSIESSNFGKINLLVGTSGSGKSRFLNVLFNMAAAISRNSRFDNGSWHVEILSDDLLYEWDFQINDTDPLNRFISNESLLSRTQDGKEVKIISRNENTFSFLDQKLPRLQKDIPGITLLKEEPIILPVFNTFTHMKRRLFYDAGLRDALAYENVPPDIIDVVKKKPSMEIIWKGDHTVGTIMYILKNVFPDLYDTAIESLMEIFPFIVECDVQLIKAPPLPGLPVSINSIMPSFVIKEKSVTKWIQLKDLSSGMQKVLLIISDILTLPKGSIYLIDEYENSLGVNAIDFLPDFLINHSPDDAQFFITTHHPYLINNMPMNNWRIFHRQGSSVTIKDGSELIDKYGKSKQKAFIQLMNDPFYTGEEI